MLRMLTGPGLLSDSSATTAPPGLGNNLVLAIDQGTTGSTAALFEPSSSGTELHLVAHANREFRQIYPSSGLVEHDAEAIWESVVEALAAVLNIVRERGFQDPSRHIACIGITNQRETVVCIDRKSGKPLANAIVWQDRRTAARCSAINADKALAASIRHKTGLVVDPYFSATKMQWLMEHNNQVRDAIHNGQAVFATMDAFLCHRLTGGDSFVTEPTNACRTLLVQLETGEYDCELLSQFGIPLAALAPIRDSIGQFGTTSTKHLDLLPEGIPITALMGDQQSALYGQRAHFPGEAKLTFGTGSFILMNTGSAIVRPSATAGLLTSIALRHKGQLTYCLEGACFVAGAAIQFLRDQLNFFVRSADCEALALSDDADGEVEFVPSLAGLSAPFWNPLAKGVLFGLSRGTSKSQITRAVLESIALQHVPMLGEMQRSSGIPLRWLGVDGGAAANEYLLQYQADLMQTPLRRPEHLEATVAGAALAAWTHLAPQASHETTAHYREIKPQRQAQWAEQRYKKWLRAAAAVHAYYDIPMDS